MRDEKRSHLFRNFVLILCAYTLGAWLYSVPFVGDQKIYIATAKEMLERGSFLHPYLFGETSYFKPPWLYWTLLAGWKLFGFNLFGTFFFSFLAVALSSLVIDLIALEQDDKMPTAGIWFAACTGTLTYGTTAQMEIWIIFFYSLAWYCFLKHFKSGHMKWLVLGSVVAGISAWNKSPLYSVFSVGSYSFFLLIQKNYRSWLLKPSFYLAHCIGAGVGASWFVAMWLTDRERFFNQYILQETLDKRGGNGGTVIHMWLDFLTFTLPFLLLLIPIFLRLHKINRNKILFLLSWSLIPAAFFSYFPYRTETYLYILIPALVLLLDWGLKDCVSYLLKWTVRCNGLLIGLILLGFALLLALTNLVDLPWVVLLVVTGVGFFIASYIVSGIASFMPSGRLLPKSLLAFSALGVIIAIRLCAISLGEKDIQDLRKITELYPQRKLAFLDNGRNIWNEMGLLSVATGNHALRLFTSDEAFQAVKEGAILVLNPNQVDLLSLKGSQGLQGLLELPNVRTQPWHRLQRKFAVPSLQDLRQVGESKNRLESKIVWIELLSAVDGVLSAPGSKS